MGAHESKNRRNLEEYEESGQFSESQVGHLLEEQKLFYEQKMAKLKNPQQIHQQQAATSNFAQQARPTSGTPVYSGQQAASSSFAQQAHPTPGAPVYPRQQAATSSFAPQACPTSGTPAYPGPQYMTATSAPNPQQYSAPLYPRVESVATGSSAQVSQQTYGVPSMPVYPNLVASSYVVTSGSTPMPVFISSPSAPPLESMDRPRAPCSYTQNDLQQETTSKNQAQSQQASTSGVSSRPAVPSPTTKQPQPGTPNSSDYVFVNRKGETERTQSAAPRERERSASRSRPKKNQEDDEIKCPTCKRTYGLTIYNCPNGHSSCNDCKSNARACGKCYLNITNTRNITLEAYLAERKADCPYSEDGCSLFIKLADMESHVKECPFREMTCPLDSIIGKCSWKGKLSEVESHFSAFHPMQSDGNVDTEMYLNLTNENLSAMNSTHIARLVIIGPYRFIFHLRLSQADQKIYSTVWMLSTALSASKWTYEIHIYNKSQPRRKYQHTDLCHSVNNKLDEIFKEAKCAEIPVTYASTFVNEKKLTFKFYIKKDVNEKGFKNNRGRGRGAHRK